MGTPPHLAHLSAHTPNPSRSLVLLPNSTVNLFFPLALYPTPQLIPLFPHHSNANLIPFLLPPAFPDLPSALLNQQIILQIRSAHTVNLIHIPLDVPASYAKQQGVAAGNLNKSPFSTATDCLFQVAKPLTRSKWNEKNYLPVNGGKIPL